MNKYQYMVFKNMKVIKLINEEDNSKNGKIDFVGDPFQIKFIQNEDYHFTKYNLVFETEFSLEKTKILFNENGKWNEVKLYQDSVYKASYLIDFNRPFTQMKIINEIGIFDEFIVPVVFEKANADEYDSKIREAKEKLAREEAVKLGKKINPDYKVGDALVNFYWDIVSNEVRETNINLYLYSNGQYRRIRSFKEDISICYETVKDLAYGDYCYEIIEIDSKGKIIASTDKIKFEIKRPSSYNGRPIANSR